MNENGGIPIDVMILDKYDELSPSGKAVADFILEIKGDIHGYTATELAEISNVSKATVARFFRTIGYASYEEARLKARLARNWGSPLINYEAYGKHAGAANPLDQIKIEHTNTTRTFERIDMQDVNACVDILFGARTIWIAGFRNSYGIAHYGRFLLKMLVHDVRILPQTGLSFAEELSGMSDKDCLLAVGLRKRPSVLRLLMERTRAVGMKNIYITDTSAANTARLADIIFRCHTSGPYLFDSQATGMSLLNFIVTCLALRMGSLAIERLANIDRLHEEIDSFSHHR